MITERSSEPFVDPGVEPLARRGRRGSVNYGCKQQQGHSSPSRKHADRPTLESRGVAFLRHRGYVFAPSCESDVPRGAADVLLIGAGVLTFTGQFAAVSALLLRYPREPFADEASGSVKPTTAPPPSRLRANTLPPWSSTMPRETARPIPLPPVSRPPVRRPPGRSARRCWARRRRGCPRRFVVSPSRTIGRVATKTSRKPQSSDRGDSSSSGLVVPLSILVRLAAGATSFRRASHAKSKGEPAP